MTYTVNSYFIGIEFEAGSFTNVTDDVLQFSAERRLANPFANITPGSAMFELDNPDGKYSPDHALDDAYVELDGTANARVSTPHASGNTPSGDFSVFGYVKPNSWGANETIISKDSGAGNSCFLFTFFQSKLRLSVSADGTNYTTAACDTDVPFSEGWVAAGFDLSTRECKFFRALQDSETDPASLTYAQFGSTETLSIASIFASTSPLHVGAQGLNGGAGNFTGRIYRAGFTKSEDPTSQTNRVLMDPTQWTRPNSTFTSGTGFGEGVYTLYDGTDIEYLPALYGLHEPNQAIKAQAITDQGSAYDLFLGEIDEWRVSPDLGKRTTMVSARDRTKILRTSNISTGLFANYAVNSLFVEVLGDTDVSSYTITAMPDDEAAYAWFRDIRADTALSRLLESSFYHMWPDAVGGLHIHHRFMEVDSRITISSLGDVFGMSWALTDDGIINDAKVQGQPRLAVNSSQVLGVLEHPITIPSSSHISFFLEFLDPITGEAVPGTEMITPVSSQDFLTFTNSDGTGTNKTATTSVAATFFAQTSVNTVFNGSDETVWLTKFQLRGKAVLRGPRYTGRFESSSSQGRFGKHAYALSTDMLKSAGYAQNYAGYLVNRHKERAPNIEISIRNDYQAILDADLAQLFHITNDHTGVASLFLVTGLRHSVDMTQGLLHQLDLDVELQRPAYYSNQGAAVNFAELTASLTGISDASVGILSAFVKLPADAGNNDNLLVSSGFSLQFGANDPSLVAYNSVGSEHMIIAGQTNMRDDQWHHVLFAWDATNSLALHYMDDADNRVVGTYVNSTVFDYSTQPYRISGTQANSGGTFQGAVQELYVNFSEFIDIRSADNRRKFISATGRPAFLGVNGVYPTGNQPDIYLRRPFDAFQINDGSAGDFTVASSGASIGEESSSPSSV